MRIAICWSELIQPYHWFRKRNQATFPRTQITRQRVTFLTRGFFLPRFKFHAGLPFAGPNACNQRACSCDHVWRENLQRTFNMHDGLEVCSQSLTFYNILHGRMPFSNHIQSLRKKEDGLFGFLVPEFKGMILKYSESIIFVTYGGSEQKCPTYLSP